jgi:hypothetical protein
MSWCSDAPEDETISLFEGLLANPDMTLSFNLFRHTCFITSSFHFTVFDSFSFRF